MEAWLGWSQMLLDGLRRLLPIWHEAAKPAIMRQLDIDLNNASKGLPHLHIEKLYELLDAALLKYN